MTDALALSVLIGLGAYYVYRVLAIAKLPPVAWARERIHDAVIERFGDEWADGLTCPWCLGFWCVVIIVGLVDLAGSVPLPALQVVAASTIVGALGWWFD